jgi:Flavodoxins
MRKIILTALITLFMCGTYAFAADGVKGAQGGQVAEKSKKILIVYYSWSGNTGKMAKMIQKETGGEIFEIQTEDAYPKEYKATTEQAKEEINKGYKPAIKGKVNNINEYDIIFVGSPNWWGTIAPAVTTFLTEYDLSGKTVAPFFTHGGGGLQNCFADTKKLLPNSKVSESLAFSGYKIDDAQKELSKWVKEVVAK